MSDVSYRPFRREDVSALVALIGAGMPADAVSAGWFTENVLLDPNFDPGGLIVADRPGQGPLGFVYATRRRGNSSIPVDPVGGWITIGVVRPDVRRRGIGTELLARSKAFLASAGAHWVNVSAYPPAYFLPGLDAELYPDTLRFLESRGFRTLYRPVAMDLPLATYRTPDAVLRRRADREGEGYTFGPAAAGDLPEAVGFAEANLAPDWGAAIRETMIRHGRPERLVLARDPDSAVVGFAIYGAYRGLLERFGPFGVEGARRGLGLGKIVLHDTLTRMRAEGAHSAWFLWTGRDSPAGHLYADAGFTVTRTFHVLQADLAQ